MYSKSIHKLNMQNVQLWKDDQTNTSYIINADEGSQRLCMHNGDKIKKFVPGVTGQVSKQQRMLKTKINLKIDSIETNPKAYIPQPTKFEGYSNFPRPASKPYTNKLEYFKSNVIKVPKTLAKNRFLNSHNRGVMKSDISSTLNHDVQRISSSSKNNVGISYMTASFASTEAQDYTSKSKVLEDFRSSKIIKQIVNKGLKVMDNKMVANKVLKLQTALSNNVFGNTIHGRKLAAPRYASKASNRSYSANKYESKQSIRSRRGIMNMTAYTGGFGGHAGDKVKSNSVMAKTHFPSESIGASFEKAKNATESMFYPRHPSMGRETGINFYGANDKVLLILQNS